MRHVEIARYPVRCARCGATDQVRVEVHYISDEMHFRSEGMLPTVRVGPMGWTWYRGDGGQPRWLCRECSKVEADG